MMTKFNVSGDHDKVIDALDHFGMLFIEEFPSALGTMDVNVELYDNEVCAFTNYCEEHGLKYERV